MGLELRVTENAIEHRRLWGCLDGKISRALALPRQPLPTFPSSLPTGFLSFLSQVYIIQVENEHVFSGENWKSKKSDLVLKELQILWGRSPPAAWRSDVYAARLLCSFLTHQSKKTSRHLRSLQPLRKASNVKDRIKGNKEGKGTWGKILCREQRKTSNGCYNLHLQNGDTRTLRYFLKEHINMIKILRIWKL